MIIRFGIVLLVLALIFGGIFGWKYQQARQSQGMGGPPPVTVSSAQVRTEQWQSEIAAVGSIVATEGVLVTNEVAGQIAEILFESGHTVKKGDPLVKLDDRTDHAELDALVAEQQLAEVRFNRTSRLLKDNMISRSDYDETRSQYEIGAARVAAQRALVEKKMIRAPFSGRLGIREVNIGQYLPPGSQIVSLQSFDPIFADFTLPERHLSRLATGQTIQVKVQAYADRSFPGVISAIEPRIETRTRNLRARATLKNPTRELQPGMFAEVGVIIPQQREVLTLPRTALTYAPYGDSVFVIDETSGAMIARQRQIQTGEIRGERVEVASGLQSGELVISAGQVKLRDGQPIRINNSVDLESTAGP